MQRTHTHRKQGIFGILAIVFITIGLWLLRTGKTNLILTQPLFALAQIVGLVGIVLLALNLLLSARTRLINRWLGGLDKMYLWHRWTGQTAFVLMLAHPLFFLLSALPNFELIKTYFVWGQYWPYTFGSMALWGFIILIGLTLVSILPYHIWKMTHRFMIVPFWLSAVHAFLAGSDLASLNPLAIWIGSWLVLGSALYIYKVFLYPFIGPRHLYHVREVQQHHNIVELVLQPIQQGMMFEPGQFAYLNARSHRVSSESHPFSLASAPGEELLRLAIKTDGDYTATLPQLQPDETVALYGPYGRFGDVFLQHKQPLVWMAGGIGVTPFLSMLAEENRHPHPERDIWFFWTVSKKEEAVYQQQIERIAKKHDHIHFVLHVSSQKGHLNHETLQQAIPEFGKTKSDFHYLICGPRPMMFALSDQLQKEGVPRRRITFEDFMLK